MKWVVALIACVQCVAGAEISFSREVAPILHARCTACHGREKARGGYRVNTFAATGRAGKSGKPAIVAGDPTGSELFQRLVTADPDDRMPQEDKPLSPAEIEIIRRWIDEGAQLDLGSPETTLSLLLPRPPHPTAPARYPRPLPVLTLAFDSSGETLAVNGYHEINLWSAEGALKGRIGNVPARVRSLAFHPREGILAAAGGKPGDGGELSIYNTATRQLESNLLRTPDELLCLAFSPDGQLLAAGGTDNTIHLFSTDTWKKTGTIQQHADWVTALSFDPSGEKIASASRDRTARVYEALAGTLETTYPSHNAPVTAIAFATADLVVSAGRDTRVQFWSVNDGRRKHEISGLRAEIHHLAATSAMLFSACGDRLVRQHSLDNRALVREYTGHRDTVFAIAVHSSSGRLASGSYDGEVRIWNIEDGTLISRFIAAPGDATAAN